MHWTKPRATTGTSGKLSTVLFWVPAGNGLQTLDLSKSVKTETQNRSAESPRLGAQGSHSCLPKQQWPRGAVATMEPRTTGRQPPREPPPGPGPPASITQMSASRTLPLSQYSLQRKSGRRQGGQWGPPNGWG